MAMDKFDLVPGDTLGNTGGDASDKTMVILQSLLCLLREKNLLSRADIEELCVRVEARAADREHDPLPCCTQGAVAAASEMQRIGRYIGQQYGGKHRRN